MDLYIVQNLSRGGVCETLGISESTLRAILRYWKIAKPYELQRKCQIKGVKRKAESGWYRENSIRTWNNPKIRAKRLRACKKSRTETWRKHLSEGQRGRCQPESQKQKMRELWASGRWDFFRSESYWEDKREEYSMRTRLQFARMTEKERIARGRHLSSVFAGEQCQMKRRQAFSKNGTWSTSKPEDLFAEKIRETFPRTSRQYRSNVYPFNCDFYIPELDLYIELNLHWTHGGRPYIGTQEDLQVVKTWENKKTRYYDTAIRIWTERDPKKRDTAARNRLNFVECFSWGECQCLLTELANNRMV